MAVHPLGRPSRSRLLSTVLLMATGIVVGCRGNTPEQSPPAPLRVIEEWRLDGRSLRAVRWIGEQHGDGLEIVSASQSGVIQDFDAFGVAHQVFGAVGSGSAGFRSVSAAGHAGNATWIYDGPNNRITVVSGGQVQRVQSIGTALPRPADSARIGMAYKTNHVFAYYTDGSRLVMASPPHPLVPPEGGLELRVPQALVRVGRDSVIQRVIAMIPADQSRVSYRPGQRVPGYWAPVPFVMAPVWSVSSDGSRIAIIDVTGEATHPTAVVLQVLKANGDTVVSRVLPIPFIPLPSRVADSALADGRRHLLSAQARQYPAIRPLFDSVAKAPSVYPPVDEAVVGDDGTVWVRLGPNPERPAQQEWMIIDRGGRVAGIVVTPADVRIMAVTLDRAWGTQPRDDHMVDIVRYRVTRGESGTLGSAAHGLLPEGHDHHLSLKMRPFSIRP